MEPDTAEYLRVENVALFSTHSLSAAPQPQTCTSSDVREGPERRAQSAPRPAHVRQRSQRAVASNVLQRRFSVDEAVPAWTSDITCVASREGWLYPTVIALQTRQVFDYSHSGPMPEELVLNALCNAGHIDAPPPGTQFHSDHGSHYASDDFREVLGALGMPTSMIRKANCWDNAASESTFETLKNEEETEPYATKQEAHRAIAQCMYGFYNHVRLHLSLRSLSPNEHARRMHHFD